MYITNKCHRCGAPRVKGSTLCSFCLVRQLNAEKKEKEAPAEAARRLRAEVVGLRFVIDRLLQNASERNQTIDTLRNVITEIKEKLRKAVEDEDDRMAKGENLQGK